MFVSHYSLASFDEFINGNDTVTICIQAWKNFFHVTLNFILSHLKDNKTFFSPLICHFTGCLHLIGILRRVGEQVRIYDNFKCLTCWEFLEIWFYTPARPWFDILVQDIFWNTPIVCRFHFSSFRFTQKKYLI